jgi:hypothetical protein
MSHFTKKKYRTDDNCPQVVEVFDFINKFATCTGPSAVSKAEIWMPLNIQRSSNWSFIHFQKNHPFRIFNYQLSVLPTKSSQHLWASPELLVQAALANAIAQPRTVMVKSLNAILANRAMSTPRWPVDVTFAVAMGLASLELPTWQPGSSGTKKDIEMRAYNWCGAPELGNLIYDFKLPTVVGLWMIYRTNMH